MKTLVIYTHPNPKSFNHAILETVEATLKEKKHDVKIRDLYADPIKSTLDVDDFDSFKAGIIPEDIKKEQQLLKWAENLVFVYPLWWFDRPALLKGYIDRVFSKGFAFDYAPTGAIGLLPHKKALVIQTAGTPQAIFEKNNAFPGIESAMLDGTLKFSGIQNSKIKTFCGVPSATHEERQAMLVQVKQNLLSEW
jgi:NAD(P)H dehydrogenase (quinone)